MWVRVGVGVGVHVFEWYKKFNSMLCKVSFEVSEITISAQRMKMEASHISFVC